jgi:hypothetical protein
MRQRKSYVAASDGRQIGRKINELMRDEGGPARPLAAAAIMLAPITTRRNFSNICGQTTRLAIPVSSSRVMNITPLALPGRCRTSTRIGTGGIAALLLIAVATGAQGVEDVALGLALLAAFASAAFVNSVAPAGLLTRRMADESFR